MTAIHGESRSLLPSIPDWLRSTLDGIGQMASLFGDSCFAVFRRPFQLHEMTTQIAFIARVSILPVIFVTMPFTVIIQFFLGQLLAEIGAIDLAGAGAGFAIIRELGPFCAVLVVAGAGSTAVTADLGARTIREEIDAMKVLGVDPVHRLVVPRLLAFGIVSVGLFGFVAFTGILCTFLFSVLVQGASPGLFVANLTLLTTFPDFLLAIFKSLVFGLAAGLVACHLGLTAKGGPKGVGNAVNQAVVFSLLLLAVINTVTSAVYQQIAGG